MEAQAEITDEMALRSFDLHPVSDGQGGVSGLSEMSDHERVGLALSTVAHAAWSQAEGQMGPRVLAATGPLVRELDGHGYWAELKLPRMSRQRDDGTYAEGAWDFG